MEKAYRMTLPLLGLDSADGEAKELIERSKTQNGMIPNMYAAVKTISNYANHLFQTPVDPVFKAHEWKAGSSADLGGRDGLARTV